MRVKVDELALRLAQGDRVPAGQVIACQACQALFIGRAGSLYCSARCGARVRQRRKRGG